MLGELIGYLAGFCTAVCFLPQSWKTITSRETKGLSLLSYIVYSIGIACWVVYGCYLHSLPMIIFNSCSLCCVLPILYLIIKNKQR